MSSTSSSRDPATQRLLDTIEDEEFAARYPSGAHFIDAGHPDQGTMATRALFAGEPVVLVFPDGHELLMTPEQARGLAGLFLLAAAFWLRVRRRREGADDVQFPLTHIEARDAGGQPIAA